jgi:hypothetical protein
VDYRKGSSGNCVENPPLAKGDEGGFCKKCFTIIDFLMGKSLKDQRSIGKDIEIFMFDKISPNPSLPKRGIIGYNIETVSQW